MVVLTSTPGGVAVFNSIALNHSVGARCSYSNFRFLAEMLLADTLPREIETALLAWHNSMGGRLGGAARFMDHLDDFPSSSWAYAALTNNQTADFLALLYGHMATYSSRGTFHATEQLQIESDGDAYRHYSPTYKGDVSLCVPTAVEVARLTRWQLVFEPHRSDSGHKQVWLARGAPKRWFRDAGGFGFGDRERPVPLASGGTVAFEVSTAPAAQSATFNVTLHGDEALVNDGTRFVLRWPGALQGQPAVGGCTVVATEPSNGLVVVVPIWSGAGPAATASLSVSGRWKTDDRAGETATEPNGTMHFLSGYPDARCLDGSPAAYILREGAEKAKFLLFHQGGGVCDSLASCKARASTSLGSSTTYPRGSAAMGEYYGQVAPYFSRDELANPLFHNFTQVYVQYCDGGLYSGDRRQPVPVPGGNALHYRGRFITEALVADLLAQHGLKQATDIVVGGCSAGGLHVLAHLDRLRSLLPVTARVAGYSDSGLPMGDFQPLASRYRFLTTAPTGANGTWLLSPACVAAESEPARCLTPSALATYTATPMFLFQSQFDLANVRDPAVNPQLGCEASPACMNALGANWSKVISQTIGRQQRHSVYVDSCARHCEFGVHPTWMPPRVRAAGSAASASPKTPMQAFSDWYRGAGRQWWQNRAYPCLDCCNRTRLFDLLSAY